MSSLMDVISEESVIILKSGITVRGTTEVSTAIQMLMNKCYIRGVNIGLLYGSIITLGIIGGYGCLKNLKLLKKT